MLKESDVQYLLFFYNNCNVPISQHYELEKRFEKEFRTTISSSFKVDFGENGIDDSFVPSSSSKSSSNICSSTCSSGSSSASFHSNRDDDTVREMPIISIAPEKLKRYYENFDDTEDITLEDVIERLKILDNLSKE
jgi:hypothetical protein